MRSWRVLKVSMLGLVAMVFSEDSAFGYLDPWGEAGVYLSCLGSIEKYIIKKTH